MMQFRSSIKPITNPTSKNLYQIKFEMLFFFQVLESEGLGANMKGVIFDSGPGDVFHSMKCWNCCNLTIKNYFIYCYFQFL